MKKILIGISLLIFLFGAFLFIYVKSLDPGELRRMLLYEVERRIHGQCSLDELEVSGLGSVYAKGLKISTVQGSRIVEIDQLRFSMNLSDLINSKLRFTSLKIDGLRVFAEKVGSEWNFNQVGFLKDVPSQNPRRLSLVANAPVKAKGAFQIDSFISTDALIHVQGQAAVRVAVQGRVINDQIHFDAIHAEGPGQTKLEAHLLVHLTQNQIKFEIAKGSLDIGTINTLFKRVDIEFLPAQLSGLVQISGLLQWNESKFAPDIKFLSKQIKGFDKGVLTNFQGFWNPLQFKGLTNLDSFVKGGLKWSIKPYDGQWLWPNIYTGEFILDNIVTANSGKQKIKSEAALVVSSEIVNVQTFKLISEQGDDRQNLITAGGSFSLTSRSGELKLVGREFPVSLVLPNHKGRIHGEAQLVLAKHFGMDYEIYGKMQDHSSDLLQLGNINFHVAGQIDKETFEFSKYSLDIGKKGTVRGSGLFRFNDPVGSLASVSYIENLPISSLMTSQNFIPPTYVDKAKVNVRNQRLTLRASNLKFSEGLVDIDLTSGVDSDLEKLFKSFRGKISLRQLSVPMLANVLFQKVQVIPLNLSGVVYPGSNFDVEIQSKESKKTKLRFQGKLDNLKPRLISNFDLTGNLDLDDLHGLDWFVDNNLSGDIDIKGFFENEQLKLTSKSKSIHFQPKGLPSKLKFNNLSSEVLLGLDGQFKANQTNFDIFDGNLSVISDGNFNDLTSTKSEIVIRNVDIERLLANVYPSFKNYFKGRLNANLKDIHLSDDSEGEYPIGLVGDFNLSDPVYVYHESVIRFLDDLQQDLNKGWLKQIIQLEKMNWKEKASRQSEFLDTAPQYFSFNNGRLQVNGLELFEKRRRYSTKLTKPLEFFLPNDFREDGYLKTEVKLTASNQFIKHKVSFLRDAYEQDLNLTLILEGPPSNSLSENQLMEVRQKIASEIGSNFDARKIETAAKAAAKKAAQKVKQQLIRKSNNIVENTLKQGLSNGAKKLLQKVVKSSGSASVATGTTTVNPVEDSLDEVEQKVKKKLRSFLQDLF